MATLTIRNLDDSVVKALKKRATENHRSLEAELRIVLSQASRERRLSREEFWQAADRIRAMTPKDRKQTDSTLLIRQDRDR